MRFSCGVVLFALERGALPEFVLKRRLGGWIEKEYYWNFYIFFLKTNYSFEIVFDMKLILNKFF